MASKDHTQRVDSEAAWSDPDRLVFLYGTTPPRADAGEERTRRTADRLTDRTRGLDADGLVVYDVQDEAGRTSEPRPFPFLPTLDSRDYSRRLGQMTGLATITYKCVAGMSPDAWQTWLEEAGRDYGVTRLSLVGPASSRDPDTGISLAQAIRVAAIHPHGFTLGGVVIPERHTAERSESRRLRQKTELGCRYFISQAVYDPEATIRLLRDYAQDCQARSEPPQRVVLTFTPCGRPETLRFMKWLGIAVPVATERALLTSPTPLAESIQLCADHWQKILTADENLGVPLGVNVESISIRKEEIEGSIELFHRLREVAAPHRS